MRIPKSLNSTIFFFFLSLVTHGYNTQILLKHDYSSNHQKKCISNPNLNKLNEQNLKHIFYYRKNRSIGLEIAIFQSFDFTPKQVFVYTKVLAPSPRKPYSFFAITSNPKRGPPLV